MIKRFVGLFFVLLLSSCASQFGAGDSGDMDAGVEGGSTEEAQVPSTSVAQYNFLKGELALQEGKIPESLGYFEAAVQADPASTPALRLRLIQLYVRTGKLQEALEQADEGLASKPDDVQLLQLKAGLLATLHRNEEAIAIYQKIISSSKEPQEEIYVLLASLYGQSGQIERGIELLQELIKKSPKSYVANYYMAKLFEASGKSHEAENYYQKAIKLVPANIAIALDFARFLVSQKRADNALKICESMLKQDPENIVVKKFKTQILLGQSKFDEAISQLEEIGKLEDNPTDARLKIAIIKIERQNFPGAITELNLVLASQPEHAVARYYLAVAYANSKNEQAALNELEKIPQDAEVFTQAVMYEIFLLQQMQDYGRASLVAKRLIDAKPDNPRVYALKASIDAQRKAYAEAVDMMRKAVELDPQNDGFAFSLGVYLDNVGKKSESQKYLEKAIELNPKHATALNYLGYSLAEEGKDLDKALSYIKRALESEPNSGYYIDSLGWVYYQMGKYQDALVELEKASKLVPNDADILEHVARARFKLGDKKGARDAAKDALERASSSQTKGIEARIRELIEEIGE